MDYKIAVVTGASAGIGRAICLGLGEKGVKLILLARRIDKLEELKKELEPHTDCHIICCDISNKEKVNKEFENLPPTFQKIDILVNCAGLALGMAGAPETNWEDWETMINVNCTGLAYITRLLLPGMVERNLGHIVNIGSVAGAYPYPGGNVYGATKAFVDQFSLNLKADLLGTEIRVTNIEPGMVDESEFSLVRFKGDKGKADLVYKDTEPLHPGDVAESVLWVLERPGNVNINKIELMPVNQASAGFNIFRKK